MSIKATRSNTVASDTPTSIKVSLAPFWKRLAAWVYDLLGGLAVFILSLVAGYLLIYFVTLPWLNNGEALSHHLYTNPLWAIYIFACIQYYYCWCWVKGGQTVGMRTWHLKLCKPSGEHLNWKEAYYRSFLSFGGLANLWCLLDSEKRGWHDIVCHSRVVVLPKHYGRANKPLI